MSKDRTAALLESNLFWLFARLLLSIVFLSGGLAKLILFDAGIDEMRSAGLEPAWLFNSIVGISLITGAVLILFDRYLFLAATGLSVFLLLTILVIMYTALEHISLIGGLLGTAIASHLRKTMFGAWQNRRP
jgi:transmembrane protein